MRDFHQPADDYRRIEQAIAFISANRHRQPDLSEIAASVHLTEYHFQRLFSRWAGISPKRFMQYLTSNYAKKLLRESHSVLDSAYEAGLSGPGRLHDLLVTFEAMTPGELKRAGEGLTVHYGFHPTPFGECLLGSTSRGICGLYFLRNGNHGQALDWLRSNKERAKFVESPNATAPLTRKIFSASKTKSPVPLHLYVRGTNFQVKVWEALMQIPAGAVVSYEDLAAHLYQPRSARAVGNAVAKNPISYLIPCHRVIRKVGETGNYLGGPHRKKALLAWEASKWGSELVNGE